MCFFNNIYLKYFVTWYCDNCEAHLNSQKKFSILTRKWTCLECGYVNDITSENIKNESTLKQQEEIKRQNTECKFEGNISFEKFRDFALSVGKQIKRLQIDVEDTFVTGTVQTISGIHRWRFKIDFNDFGEITGKYWWIYCESSDSKIPNIVAERLSQVILHENEVYQRELNNPVH